MTAKSFDSAIEQRFANPGEQALPCLRMKRRSWRTAWRWQEQWQPYRDDESVSLQVKPCEGEVWIDPLSKVGSATIQRLSFVDSKSGDVIKTFAGRALIRCLSVENYELDCSVSERGLRMQGDGAHGFVRVIAPSELKGASCELEIDLRAEPPPSWFHEGKSIE